MKVESSVRRDWRLPLAARYGGDAGRALPGAYQSALICALICALASLAGLGACADVATAPLATAPPAPPAIASLNSRAQLADALTVDYVDRGADSVRATYVAADGSDSGATPWFPAATDSLAILGLRPGTSYSVTLQSERGGLVADGSTATRTTAALPAALQQVQMVITAGGAPTGGYTLTNIDASDGHGYAVAFDSTGEIRWYHDVGAVSTGETKQQRNGDITVYAGNTRGYDPVPGAYVEVSPEGDSVRSISAVGSAYTDQHELVTTYDAHGTRTADYLFGYDIRPVDRTAVGGGPYDPVAGHQVLRIAASGAVDTLVQGWSLWTASDYVDPFSSGDMDHPNSIDIDRNGDVIISYRDIDAVVDLDPATHAILWQLGGRNNEFRFVNDPENGFGGQHDVRVLPNGHLLLFDNGTTHSPQASRAAEYAIDPLRKTATLVWQYAPEPPVFNTFTGSAQRLANGNTVVAWSTMGLVDEVSPSGALVSRAQISSAPGSPAGVYRAIRIASLYHYAAP